MGIILKHLFNNIKEKKSRTLLIIMAIMITTAVFIINIEVKSSLIKMYSKQLRSSVGEADIVVKAKEESKKNFFEMKDINLESSEFETSMSVFGCYGKYIEDGKDAVKINIVGTDLNELNKINPIIFIEKEAISNFTGEQVIISKKTSEKLGVKLGDKINFKVNEKEKSLTVFAISDSSGIFMNEQKNITFIMPLETVNEYYGLNNKINLAYIKLKDLNVDKVIKELSDKNEDFIFKEAIDKKTVDSQVGGISSALTVSLVVVLLVSFYIILSLFKVIILERTPVMGTFMSVGATKKRVNFILMFESILYGIVGGILGISLGYILTGYVAEMLNTLKEYGIKANVEYNIKNLVFAFLFALFISIVSVIIPIIKFNKYPTKEVILNTMHTPVKFSKVNLIIGIFLLSLATVLNIKVKYNFVLNLVNLVLVIIGFVLILPFMVMIISRIYELTISKTFGSEAELAAKNLRNNKIIINNIILTSVGIGLMIMLYFISNSIQSFMISASKEMKYDIAIRNVDVGKDIDQVIKQNSNIRDSFYVYSRGVVASFNGTDIGKIQLDAYDEKSKITEFYSTGLLFKDSKETIQQQLFEGKNILLEEFVADMYGIKKGEKLKITFSNKNTEEYNVVGFYKTKIVGTRRCGLISLNSFKKDIDDKPLSICIKSNIDVKELENNLTKELADTNSQVISVEDDVKQQQEAIGKITKALNIFVGISIIMGFFGIGNNLIVSFIQRKRELAVLYSICMSRFQLKKMVFFETISSFSIACLLGGALGIIISKILPKLLGSVGLAIDITYSINFIIGILAITFIVLSITSVFSIIRLSKLAIVKEIKYE